MAYQINTVECTGNKSTNHVCINTSSNKEFTPSGIKTKTCRVCTANNVGRNRGAKKAILNAKNNWRRYAPESEGGRAESFKEQQKVYWSKNSNRIIRNYRSRQTAALKYYGLDKYDVVNKSSLELLGDDVSALHRSLNNKGYKTFGAYFDHLTDLHLDHMVSFKWAKDTFGYDESTLIRSMRYICNIKNLHLIPRKTNLIKGGKLLDIYVPLANLIIEAVDTDMDIGEFYFRAHKLEQNRLRRFNNGYELI